ncbi:hypothetical protein BaRGS_00028730 [Batillaria attramentaria]|uniref:Uncharacterized protein n=1 Tax=Batillaria attramentaria TaxID=370345 RepID=A0ABD0JYA7_9CAEN
MGTHISVTCSFMEPRSGNVVSVFGVVQRTCRPSSLDQVQLQLGAQAVGAEVVSPLACNTGTSVVHIRATKVKVKVTMQTFNVDSMISSAVNSPWRQCKVRVPDRQAAPVTLLEMLSFTITTAGTHPRINS